MIHTLLLLLLDLNSRAPPKSTPQSPAAVAAGLCFFALAPRRALNNALGGVFDGSYRPNGALTDLCGFFYHPVADQVEER